MKGRRFFILILFTFASVNSRAQENSKLQTGKDSLNKMDQLNSEVSKTLNNTSKVIKKNEKKADSALLAIEKIPTKYFKQVDKKIYKYSSKITSKTEKTLTKLSKWEIKIKKLLDKASPETSARLFGKTQITFTSLLQKLKQGENITTNAGKKYDEYRDKLTTNLKYIESQGDRLDSGLIKPVVSASNKMKELNKDVDNSEAVEKIIRDRKKQLINESIKYIGKSKYFKKINKESYYYVETLKNYKEIFSDEKKAEETAKTILNKIPAFKKFMSENGALASLFGTSTNSDASQNIEGLQTRAQINAIIEEKIASGGPNAREMIKQNMQQAQSELQQLKDKVAKYGGNSGDADFPDFKPNNEKTKTFLQRLEYSSNFQFSKSNSLLPTIADIALGVGYKLNDKSIIGIGGSFKMGIGRIDNIKITSQGISLRSYMDWKLKGKLFVTGGYEMNHLSQVKNIQQIENLNDWQQSGLVGLSKKYKINKKLKGETKLLFDFLYKQHIPVSQPIIFRVGYQF